MASIGVIFTSTYHTKQLNPWPNSSASRVVNYSQLSTCQGDMQPFEGDPYTHGRLTSPSKGSPGNFQHQYLAELLVNVYSYCLMVKSVFCCCVRGSQLFSNLVTFVVFFLCENMSNNGYLFYGIVCTYVHMQYPAPLSFSAQCYVGLSDCVNFSS